MRIITTLQYLLLATAISVVAACKLAVIVVEGGQVISTSLGPCAAGTICVYEINDHSFNETFEAVPNPGWHFVKWNSGGDFICKDYTIPTCSVSNVGTAGNAGIAAVVDSDHTFYIMPIFVPTSTPTELNAFGASMAVGNPTTFTNGQNYVDYLASDLGILTINNWAVGGHKYTEILGQVNTFISNSGGAIKPDALYVVAVTIDFEAPLADQADTFASSIQSLHDAGAQYILAPNAHNFSMLPIVPTESRSAVELATQTFNELYANAIGGLGFPVMEVNFFGVYDTIAASPATFGITNLTDPCNDSGGSCAEPNNYFFWDTIHPTTVVHRELADELNSKISPGP